MKLLVDSKPAAWMLGGPEWTQEVAKKEGYDKVIGQTFWANNNCTLKYYSFSMDAWLPKPSILHPWPSDRFAVTHPRWELHAGKSHVRFCAGGA